MTETTSDLSIFGDSFLYPPLPQKFAMLRVLIDAVIVAGDGFEVPKNRHLAKFEDRSSVMDAKIFLRDRSSILSPNFEVVEGGKNRAMRVQNRWREIEAERFLARANKLSSEARHKIFTLLDESSLDTPQIASVEFEADEICEALATRLAGPDRKKSFYLILYLFEKSIESDQPRTTPYYSELRELGFGKDLITSVLKKLSELDIIHREGRSYVFTEEGINKCKVILEAFYAYEERCLMQEVKKLSTEVMSKIQGLRHKTPEGENLNPSSTPPVTQTTLLGSGGPGIESALEEAREAALSLPVKPPVQPNAKDGIFHSGVISF